MSNKPTRQAFLDAILNEPMASDHRLVFADWLEDRGEPEEAEKYRELPGTAAVWCKGWGTDGYGLWCDLAIGEVTQCLRWIPPGTFQMGSPEDEEGREENEGPRHRVEISRGFWMFDTPCTQELWEAVMGSRTSIFREAKRPVQRVNQDAIGKFLTKLSGQVAGLELQLPTEAQWEYACRAGTEGPRYAEDPDEIAWYRGNGEGGTHSVKEKKPNGFGLYDMLGNVWEWCRDGGREYSGEGVTDPVGPEQKGGRKALRGGAWTNEARKIRSAARIAALPMLCDNNIGFRCVMSG